MPEPFFEPVVGGRPEPTSAISARTARVLAGLPAADRQRAAARRRRQRRRIAGLWVCALLLAVCLGPDPSDIATRALAWFYAADVAWKGLVLTALGPVEILPAVSAFCLLGLSILLWHRLLFGQRRGAR